MDPESLDKTLDFRVISFHSHLEKRGMIYGKKEDYGKGKGNEEEGATSEQFWSLKLKTNHPPR